MMSNKWQKGDLIPLLGGGSAKPEHVLESETFSSNYGKEIKGTMPDNSDINFNKTITTQGSKIVVPKGYTKGGEIKVNFTNVKPENIRKGINIGGVTGEMLAADFENIKMDYGSLWSQDEKMITFPDKDRPVIALSPGSSFDRYNYGVIIVPGDSWYSLPGSSYSSGKIRVSKVTDTNFKLKNTSSNDSQPTGYTIIFI